MERATHKFLHFTSVFDFNVRLRGFVDDLEGEVLDIGLDLGIGGFATNEALGVEYARETNQHGSSEQTAIETYV